MKKIIAILILLVFVSASFLSGCINDPTDEDGGGDTTPPVTTITLDDAIRILMTEILNPSTSDSRSSAYILTEVIQTTDVLTSEAGVNYPIDANTWFFFIDDDPKEFFAHPARYVFMNADDGNFVIKDETWPPLINDFSMWDTANLNHGDLIEILPVLNSSVPITTEVSSGAPSADYGDAPDTQNAYYGVEGRFPTYYDTTNSVLDRPGGHTLTTGEEMLGLYVSAEVDADDPNDPDLIPNLVDSDKDERMFISLNVQNAQLAFTVTVDANSPDVPRYINFLIDFDQNGNWTESATYGSEWPIVNYEINVTPGTTKTIISPSFSWGDGVDLPTPVWVRVALTREEIDETLFTDYGGWDGSGQFQYGEIEDHLIYLIDNPPDPDDEWPPGEPKEPKDPQPPGSETGPCGTDVNYHSLIISGGDSGKHMRKGQYPANQAAETMTDLLADQGYSSAGNIGPGKAGVSQNSLSNIESAFETLKSQVKCGDHILIYIIGHGNPSDSDNGPGINLKGSNGKTNELLTPTKLASYLAKIEACDNEFCDVEEVNCHVTVVIESCYAGNFNIDGVKGPGRIVMGSCDDEPAEATGGGVFTSGFNDASRSTGSDTNDDDTVTPGEAFDAANSSVHKNNDKAHRKDKKDQEPWIDNQECDCKCPNLPNITGGKYAWDGIAWADEISVTAGDTIFFRVEVENNGGNKNIESIVVGDILPSGMSYNTGSSILYQNGESLGIRDPCSNYDGMLTYGLTEIAYLAPGDTIAIEYSAIIETDGTYINSFYGSGACSDCEDFVRIEDSVTIIVG